jgi:hypothetical protein
MPETQEKPRVDIRQVITSPQFCAGLSSAIENTRSSGYETLVRGYVNTDSGKVLYHPDIIVGYRQEVNPKPILDRELKEFGRIIGNVQGGIIEQMRRNFKPTRVPFPKSAKAEFVTEPVNLTENQYLFDIHTHPAGLFLPSRTDIKDINRIRRENIKATTQAINPISTIVSVPLCEWRDLYPVLFIQEDSKGPLEESLIEDLNIGHLWGTARHSNPHYNQVEALFNKNTGRMEIISQPFTLSV